MGKLAGRRHTRAGTSGTIRWHRGDEGDRHRRAPGIDCVRMEHFTRNLIGMIAAGRRGELAADLREVFAATTREQALTMAQAVAIRWEPTHSGVALLIEEGIEDCLACLAFPLAHRARIRTTNGLERLHEEIKRRTRVARIFPNSAACLRLVTALCIEQSEEWVSGRCYLDMSVLPPLFRQEALLALVS